MKNNNIFTINDVIHHKKWDSIGTIKSFRVLNNKILVWIDWNIKNNVNDDSEAFINDIEHYKNPLFTTEDGVEMFAGQTICSVHIKAHTIQDRGILGLDFKPNNDYKYFSKREKAEEYILLNKQCLSINDVAKIFVSTNYTTKKGDLYPQGQKLRDLVKQKLK